MRTLKNLLKRVFTAVAPEMTTAIQSSRARAHSQRLIREWGLLDINRKLIDRYGSTVRGGPFAGMILTEMVHREHLGPFLLGTYEAELHNWLERIAADRFGQVIDVGSSFGYYAVGLARQRSEATVIAFDTDRWARSATREMATANGASNVKLAKFCSSWWLERHLAAGSFILSDCEGYEGELFARCSAPALDSATLLIEIHDSLVPAVGERIRSRFAGTHTVEVVASRSRISPTELLEFLTPAEAETAVREFRDGCATGFAS